MNYWKISFGCFAGLVLAVVSCGHPSGGGGGSGGNTGSGGSGNCSPGTLGCACNGTSCDNGLSCAIVGSSQQCISTASGSGGTTDTGGSPGAGGAVSSGGSLGTGGAAGNGTTGSGGAISTGGNTGSGGGAAGSPGSGGAAPGGSTGSGGSVAGPNLVDNGDFSQSDTNWHFENGTANVNNGQYCETNISGSNALFGWQNATTPLMLSGSKMYTLTYKASGSGNAVIHVKVAHAVSPYTPDDYETSPDDNLNGSLQTFTHKFMPGAGDDSNTGIAFFVMAGQNICISAVSLVAN